MSEEFVPISERFVIGWKVAPEIGDLTQEEKNALLNKINCRAAKSNAFHISLSPSELKWLTSCSFNGCVKISMSGMSSPKPFLVAIGTDKLAIERLENSLRS